MQYNIFKISSLEELKNMMDEKGYGKIGKEIKSGKYTLNFFTKEDFDLKLSWKNVFTEFGVYDVPSRKGISGIILCESKKTSFAITYGTSSFLVQKFSDKEFGFDFAKRIELKELKRKSSITPHATKNSSITSFKNVSVATFDSGENITSLSFSPVDEFYGKRIDIGKSIKIKNDNVLENISILLDKIEQDLSRNIINRIPLLTKVTNKEEIDKYNEMMYDLLNKGIDSVDNRASSNFVINEFNVVGSSIYFEDEHTQYIKIGKIEEEIELNDIGDLFDLAKKHNLDIKTIIESGRIIYKNSSGGKDYDESIRKLITFEIDEENVSLFNDEWYYYNYDYYELVMDEIKTIKQVYENEDDTTREIIESSKEKSSEYREEVLNKMLAAKHNGNVLDRDLFLSKYESDYFKSKYRIEIADLVIDNEYISVKIGSAQSFVYCVDQSELAATLINAKKVDLKKKGLKEPKKIGLWFFTENKSIFNGEEVHIEKINSIMLLSKLSNWSKNVRLFNKEPIIHVSKYKD